MPGTKLFTSVFTLTIIIKSADSCGDFVRESFNNHSTFCSSMKQFTKCITAAHDAMGSPFGRKGGALISKAVQSSAKKLCHADCKLSAEKNVPINATLLPTGDALKICGFDLIVHGGGRKRRTCGRLEDAAKCMIMASTEEDYILQNDVLDVGTYVLAELVHNVFGIECPKPALEQRLEHKCIGFRQARKYSQHA